MGGRTLGIIVAALVPIGCGGRSDRDEVVPDPWIDSTYWTHRIGDSNPQQGSQVAVDSGGNVIVAWEFEGSTDIDGMKVPGEVNYPNAVLSRLSAKGRVLWSRVVPGFQIRALEVTVGDRILVAGICDGVVDLGTSPLQPGGCLALLEPDGGAVFTKRFGATWDASVEAVTSDDAGIYLAGNFEGSADLGGGPLVSGAWNFHTLLIAKLGFDGVHQWSRAFGQGFPDSIARAPDGSIVVAGRATDETDFGTNPFQEGSLFVAKLTPDGDVSSARALWVTRADNVNGLMASADGALYLGGVFYGSIFADIVDYQLLAENESNDAAGFLLRLDKNGELVWATTTLSSPYSWLSGLTATQSGNLVATGNFHGSLELGDSTLTASSQDGDLWVAEFDTDGQSVWSFTSGTTERASGADVVVQSDALVLLGSLAGTGDWGTGAVTSAGLTDMIVSRRPLP